MYSVSDLTCFCTNEITDIDQKVFYAIYNWISETNEKSVCGNDLACFALSCRSGLQWYLEYKKAAEENLFYGIRLILHKRSFYSYLVEANCVECMLEMYEANLKDVKTSWRAHDLMVESIKKDRLEFIKHLIEPQYQLPPETLLKENIIVLFILLRKLLKYRQFEMFQLVCQLILAKCRLDDIEELCVSFTERFERLVEVGSLDCIRSLHSVLKMTKRYSDSNFRHRLVLYLMPVCVRIASLDIVKFFAENYVDYSLWVNDLKVRAECAIRGDIEILEYFINRGMHLCGDDIIDAIGVRNFDYAFYVHERTQYWPGGSFSGFALLSNDIDIVRKAHALGCQPDVETLFLLLRTGLKTEKSKLMLRYLLYELEIVPDASDCMMLCKLGFAEEALQFASTQHYTWTKNAFILLFDPTRTQRYPLDYDEHLRTSFISLLCQGIIEIKLNIVIHCECVNLLEALLENETICKAVLRKHHHYYKTALRRGSLSMVKLLHLHGFVWDETDADLAFRLQHIDCLQYMFENKCPMHPRHLEKLAQIGVDIVGYPRITAMNLSKRVLAEVNVDNVLSWQSDKPYLRPRKKRRL